ncbi:MAG: hypothetical protein EXS35_11165 [Pedosphaera sp.]|nr:hypothetical protein [Pedosphaera sp.]
MTLNFTVLCYSLVGMGIVLSLVLNIVFGGFKVGKLARQLAISVTHEQFPAFLARMNQRLTELGFQAEGPAGPYHQGGSQFGVPTSHTHAKSKKVLELAADQSDSQQVSIVLSLRFKDLIVGDTGESVYADAVLKYISNETDSMKVVANRSFMAFSTLVLAGWAWVAMIGMKILRIEPFMPTMITLTVTPIITSFIAIITIALKPAELRGIWLAIIGLVAGVLAFGTAVLLAMM